MILLPIDRTMLPWTVAARRLGAGVRRLATAPPPAVQALLRAKRLPDREAAAAAEALASGQVKRMR